MICPKCGTEYRQGFTECAYCHIPLVEKLPEGVDPEELFRLSNKGLSPSDNGSFSNRDSGEKRVIAGDSEITLKAALQAGILLDEAGNDEAKDYEEALKGLLTDENEKSAKPYRSAAERLNDLKSSGITLTAVGIIGIIAVFLIASGIIPLSLSGAGRYITYAAMLILFAVFLISGVRSIKRISEMEEEVKREEASIQEITRWFTESYSGESIDREAPDMDTGEDPYFVRTRFIKGRLKERFLDLEPSFTEYIVEKLYQDTYGE